MQGGKRGVNFCGDKYSKEDENKMKTKIIQNNM